jgi:hypothetical protein
MVYYTHLGKRIDPSTGFCLASRNALQGLAQRYRNKEILVTTTKRLLDFARMYESVTVQVIEQDGVHQIHVSTDDSEIVVDGLSLRLPATDRYELFHNYQACKVRMHEQEPGWVIVHVPWERLPYALA